MKQLIVVFLAVLISSCNQGKEEKTENQIIGKWSNYRLNVTMKLESKDSFLVVRKGEWEKAFGIKPIITTYTLDSIVKSEYYSLDDQLFHTGYGKWWLRNDSLVMITENGETTYHFSQDGEAMRFKAILDWDSDGIKDDSYDGLQIKIE